MLGHIAEAVILIERCSSFLRIPAGVLILLGELPLGIKLTAGVDKARGAGLRLHGRLTKAVVDALRDGRAVCQFRGVALAVAVNVVYIHQSTLSRATDGSRRAISIAGGDGGSACGSRHGGGKTICTVRGGGHASQNVCLLGDAPQRIKLRGFRGLHRADSAGGGEHAPLGIAGVFRDSLGRDAGVAIINGTAAYLGELAGRVIGVGGGDAVLIRLAQASAAHPCGGGETPVAARFFRSETARFALHPYAVLGTQHLRYEIAPKWLDIRGYRMI